MQSGPLRRVHTRALRQAIFNPFADAINNVAQGVTNVVSSLSAGTIVPTFYSNASDGTATVNANLNLNVPLSFGCCNVSFGGSGGVT